MPLLQVIKNTYTIPKSKAVHVPKSSTVNPQATVPLGIVVPLERPFIFRDAKEVVVVPPCNTKFWARFNSWLQLKGGRYSFMGVRKSGWQTVQKFMVKDTKDNVVRLFTEQEFVEFIKKLGK